jgi:ATP-dependent Lhr-like helicase
VPGTELLPARTADYSIHRLDEHCRSGRIVWTRFASAASANRERATGPLRSTPILILPRRSLRIWAQLASASTQGSVTTSSRAAAVLEHLRTQGASFFDEIAHGTRLLKVELEEALGELVSRGLVNADSFAGLRALLVPAGKRSRHARRTHRANLMGIEDAGRWALTRMPAAEVVDPGQDSGKDSLEHVARTLLRRYGVICWRLLARESAWLPPWRELLRVYRQLEARGEIRGGRFIAGLSGEQFALAEAIPLLRKARTRPRDGSKVVIAATDPLNLVGIRTPACACRRCSARASCMSMAWRSPASLAARPCVSMAAARRFLQAGNRRCCCVANATSRQTASTNERSPPVNPVADCAAWARSRSDISARSGEERRAAPTSAD